MSEKILKSRIINKHGTAEDWSKATNFIPKQGEIIIYDPDANNENSRVKIGDGVRNVNELEFIESSKAEIADKATEADHATKADSANYATNAGSADSATKDASGNIITDTYATKTELGAVSTLVGDKSVATQISEAMANAGGGVDADTELITIADIDEICGSTIHNSEVTVTDDGKGNITVIGLDNVTIGDE